MVTKSETEWSKEWPMVNEGVYWKRYLGYGKPAKPELCILRGSYLDAFQGATTMSTPSEGLAEQWEFLGPITPADAEQLERFREAAEKAAAWIEAQTWPCQHSDQPMRCSRCASRQKAKELSTALRYALGTQEK